MSRRSDAGGAVTVLTARSGMRLSSQSSTMPRSQYPICTNPPGTYNKMMRRPMLDVKSGTVVLFGQNVGSPITHNAPTTAPARLPSPPITATATIVSESANVKYFAENPMLLTAPPSIAPPNPAMNPPSANAVTLARTGETVSADAAGSFSRTPTMTRPIPERRRWPTSTSTSTSTPSMK